MSDSRRCQQATDLKKAVLGCTEEHCSSIIQVVNVTIGDENATKTCSAIVEKVSLRSECIQQLDKWHDLMVRGIISIGQYKEFKDMILTDMKKL